ncbi:MAG: hypothetical protein E2598_07545 [Sphingobium sp.]|nr:hypothetical protein [Sphingobium sp.]
MLMEGLPAIPPFETGFQMVARHAFLVRPKKKLTVSQWAAEYLKYYDADALPFLAEIMDACGDPETCEVGDMGPAQGGKSMVGEAFIGWSIEQDPAPFMLVQPDKTAAETFVKLRINQMLNSTAVLRSQLAPVGNADNMFIKLFRGMSLITAYPVENQFRQRSVCRGWLDDYDGFPTNAAGQVDIEGKGDGVSQIEGRMTAFKGRDTKLVSSSPALGEDAGIEPFIQGGTDERLWPVCPSCGERWEIDLLRDLKFDEGTPEEAAQSAIVVCGEGCILGPSDRHKLLASLKDLPNAGFIARRPQAGKYRRTFRRDGLLALTPWPELARQWMDALIAWRSRQDEAPLRTFYNTKAGKNYRSQLSGEKPVAVDDLKKRLEAGWVLGTVPRGPVVLNLVIDVQHDRFECGLLGSAENRESWLVDRWRIDVLEDGLTQVSPFVHKEHWRVLLPLFDRTWPLSEIGPDGKSVGYAPVLSVTIDTGGSDKKGDQATEGAKFFWQAARAAGIAANRITLVKGASRITAPLMAPAQFADQKIRGGAKRNSAKLWMPGVHKIKNIIDARLRREKPGPGYIHLPRNIPEEYLDEMTAEELIDGKWEKLRVRNETWDLLVYGEAAILKPPFAQSRSDMRWVPKAFRIEWPTAAPLLETVPIAEASPQADVQTVPIRKQKSPAPVKRRRANPFTNRS